MQAKFIVIGVTAYADGSHRVELEADKTDQNSAQNFWGGKAIGRVEMTITQSSIGASFTPGAHMDVYFQ